MRRRTTIGALAASLALATAVGGCDRLGGTGGSQFVSETPGLTQIPPDERGDPLETSGTSLTGGTIDVAAERGKVVVLNVWSSNCSPCIAETPKLVAAHAKLGAAVPFIGIDIRDNSRATAQAFENARGIDYESIFDEGGAATLSLGSRYQPQGPPQTYVLDKEGRIAAIFTGQVPSSLTLVEVAQQVGDGQ